MKVGAFGIVYTEELNMYFSINKEKLNSHGPLTGFRINDERRSSSFHRFGSAPLDPDDEHGMFLYPVVFLFLLTIISSTILRRWAICSTSSKALHCYTRSMVLVSTSSSCLADYFEKPFVRSSSSSLQDNRVLSVYTAESRISAFEEMERPNKKKKKEAASAKKPRERKVMKELRKSAEAPGQQTLNSFLQRTGRSSNDGDDSTIPSGTENVQRNEQQPPSVAAQAVVEEETRSRNDPDAAVQDNNSKQEEEVVDLTTVPEDLHDDGIPESQDAASHAEQVKEDYGESGISLMQQLRPLHAPVSQSRDERESRRPAIQGCMALVSPEQFESLCAIGRQAVPITVDDGSSHPYVVDAPRLMRGMGILEKTALAHAIYSDTTCQGTLFRKEEYPSLVSSSLGMFVCVEDVIEWMMENLDGFILEEVKEAFQQQQFGAFVRMLQNQNMLHMMKDIYSGYMRPTVKIVELKISISLFDLILHIKEPGVCRMYLLEDDHTAAPSHVPGLFCDSQDNIHLYWSQPWPLGVVDTGSKGERREPFSCSDVLVMSNGVIFSPVSGRVRYFNIQGRMMSTFNESGNQNVIAAADVVHAALYGISVEEVRRLRQDNEWETDHCPIFHMNHSVHCVRLATRSQNMQNRIFGRASKGRTTYFTEREAEKKYGEGITTPGNDPGQWIPAYLAHHSYTLRDLAEFCAENQEISISLQRVEGLWVQKDTSMLCRVRKDDYYFIMPEDCPLCERAAYPRIDTTIDGVSHPVRVHSILHDSIMRHTDPEYKRPLVQRLEDGQCHIMVVDHVNRDRNNQQSTTREENHRRKLAPRIGHLELISMSENTRRAIGTCVSIEIVDKSRDLQSDAECTGMVEIFGFLQENIANVSVEALRYWWENNFVHGNVADIIRQKEISIAMNNIQVVHHGRVDACKVVTLKCQVVQQLMSDHHGPSATWVFVYFGNEYQQTVRFTCGMSACKDLMYQHQPLGKDKVDVTDSAMQQLRPTGDCIRFYKCIARPLNKTPDNERTWLVNGHVPLSMILQEKYEEIANHYKRPCGHLQTYCDAAKEKIKECTGEINRVGGISLSRCREGIRSQLLRMYNEKVRIDQEQAGGSNEHTSKCRSCLMHAIQLMPAENAHKTFLWSLDGYEGKTSNSNGAILESMIQNIINYREEILAIWNEGQEGLEDDVWDMVTTLIHQPLGKDKVDVTDSAMEQLRPTGNCIRFYKCIARPLNKTPNNERTWLVNGHVPLSMILQEKYEEIANHYKRPCGHLQTYCDAAKEKIKECTGEINRVGGISLSRCREGIRSQLLRMYNEKVRIDQEQAGGSNEHMSKCRSCLMHAIQLMPAENAHKTFLWSLDGYEGKTSNSNGAILESMIQNIINYREEILAIWNEGQEGLEDDVWDMVTTLIVSG
ncbi:LOW QUALITY PROTEIN: hypothetical protein PSENEW3n2_00002189 [Picochlorum sp. SENEW3]|nr:LOW QUALITY PROTEIN: hypothetical protein PSENEW3n2_00002189 [Picochlorum sp. SENEW3]WPT15825.1 LOW QUALITY PROTEIN: hypothetical protein PSENEW3_00002189 [Picochlorum sp. SENEW3]